MLARQEEADPIIDFIGDYSLYRLLFRGTKTWQNSNCEIIIDLILILEKLVSTVVKCIVYGTEYGSNYRAIKIIFNIIVPKRAIEQRMLFKNILWNEIKNRIAIAFCIILVGSRV